MIATKFYTQYLTLDVAVFIKVIIISGMSATSALAASSGAAVPLTMMTTTTSTTTASAASEIISPISFSAFNSAATLGHLSSRKDYYARTDLTFLVVFPLLFLAFNLCYWISLFFWRAGEENLMNGS